MIKFRAMLEEDNDSEELWMEPMTDEEKENSYSEPHEEKKEKEKPKKVKSKDE